jgi:cytoskeleton-associated protein 5
MDVVPSLVEKALGNARAGTKKKGCDLCAMYVEVENGGEGVMVSSRSEKHRYRD